MKLNIETPPLVRVYASFVDPGIFLFVDRTDRLGDLCSFIKTAVSSCFSRSRVAWSNGLIVRREYSEIRKLVRKATAYKLLFCASSGDTQGDTARGLTYPIISVSL